MSAAALSSDYTQRLLDLKRQELAAREKAAQSTPSAQIEGDWRTWLKAVGPKTFTGSFAPFHAEFWDWHWRLTAKVRRGEPISGDEMAFLALWFRGAGKSSVVEWAAISEGALLGEGYVLYVSGTQALAEGHVAAIRGRLESEDVRRYYPHLANPKIGRHGNQFGWRQDFLITAGGWAIRPVGLDVGIRGGKIGDIRPSLVIFDDCDEHSDSPHVVEGKEATIARSILPAGTAQTRLFFAQNLIHRNSVANRIYERRSGLLAKRIVSGPFAAFEGLQIEARQTETGQRNVIVGGRPTWPDIDLAACQAFLDNSGLEAFLAEYQHDFTASEQNRVIPEYDETVHVITWGQFEALFGERRIPEHWLCECGHDVGFTAGHLSAWTWIATAAMNSHLPGARFRYRGLTFQGIGVDEQAEAVKRALWPGEQVIGWRMSHEALSERKTYREKYNLPFQACDSAKTAGVSQWRHFLRVDRSKPHPFRDDEKLADGHYRLGAPGWFDIVDDDQLVTPRDDRGLATHRRQTAGWRYRPDVLGVGGMSQNLPLKADDDAVDSTRMILAHWAANSAPLTEAERLELALPAGWRATNAPQSNDPWARDGWEMARLIEIGKAKKRLGRGQDDQDDPWERTAPLQNVADGFWPEGWRD